MNNEDIEKQLQDWLEQSRSNGDRPFEWKGDVSFFELVIANLDRAIIGNQPISLDGTISYVIACRRHEHNINYFQRHHPHGCDEVGLIKACQVLGISPDRARFCAGMAVARTKNSPKHKSCLEKN